MEEQGLEGITYKDGMPDFSKFVIGEVKIDSMTDIRTTTGGQRGNYEKADAMLAETWSRYGESWTEVEIRGWRIRNGYTWHELNDMETMQLIPSAINHPIFKHLGGVGEYIKSLKH
ncbi:HNH endonuclease [Pseudoflavonifractor phocaeensis]|uniref:HNH endonuclease n=1 Tax=Pseudoflavonifractor phocaeensis TaxID=1870988 RepID=UPI0019593A5C|nr:HNH endonuclease [Pseudoflavonifractor phocaeensis]MBM6885377.1 HNH endonuclease [Pseudoflavonifractor phocaeensis]